jgi:hypothetical protein
MNQPATNQARADTFRAQAQAFPKLHAALRLIRATLVAQRVGWLIAGGVLVLVLAIGFDYLFRLPTWARLVNLIVALGTGLWYARSWLLPALRLRPSPEQLALQIEQTPAGRDAGLPGVLAAGVGLHQRTLDGGAPGQRATLERELAQPVVQRAQDALSRLTLRRVIDARPALLAVGLAALLTLAGTAWLAARPTLGLIGLQRALLPGTTAQWPKRQDLRDVTGARAHALGQALALRSALVKGPGMADPARAESQITVRYRVVALADGRERPGPWRELGAAYQGRSVDVPLRDELDTLREPRGPLFERLIEPAGLVADAAQPDAPARLQYQWIAGDEQTDVATVELVAAPAIAGATVTVTPPTYALASGVGARTVDAATGLDERATVVGILPGSRVQVELTMSKAVPPPPAQGATAWAQQALGADAAALLDRGADASLRASVSPGGASVWTLAWTHDKSVRLLPRPVDEFGLRPITEPAFHLQLRDDLTPEVAVTVPATDTEALPTAQLAVTASARDDLGLEWLTLSAQPAQRRAGSAGGAIEPVGEPAQLQRVDVPAASPPTDKGPGPDAPAPGVAPVLVSASVNMTDMKLEPGQELWLWATAQDRFELAGARHEPVRSATRKVRIISPEQLLEQMWAELGGVRRASQRLSEQQGKLEALTREGLDASQALRQQPEITEQASRLAETVSRVRQRASDNQLADPELADVLREARDLAEGAREASARALQEARAEQQAQGDGDRAGAREARQRATARQGEARQKLEDLASALDRGQDTWAARRAIERLAQEQQRLREAAQASAQQNLGRSADQLSPEERTALDELVNQQEQLARKTDDELRKIEQRAQQAQKTDQAAADALAQAAQQGRASGASQRMQQAAQSLRENRQQAAQEEQERAEAGLRQVLERLRDQATSRDAVLRRQLASLVQTLEALVAQQQAQLTRLEGALAQLQIAPQGQDADLTGLDGAMIRLHTATLAGTEQAREAGREMRAVVEQLQQAAAAQTQAVTALRQKPADAPAARASEQSSLEKLTEAKRLAEEARQKADQRQQQRQREQLRRRYEELAAEQAQLRADAADLIGVALDRRQRARARELADRQEALLAELAKVQDETEELKTSTMFSLAHQRAGDAGRAAVESLRADAVPTSLRQRHATIERVLRQMVDALKDSPQQQEFRQNQGASQSGQSGGGKPPLVPPVAQLKLLKSMQEEALELTRGADGASPADRPDLAAEARALQQTITDKGQQLLEELKAQQGGAAPGGDLPARPQAPNIEPGKVPPS